MSTKQRNPAHSIHLLLEMHHAKKNDTNSSSSSDYWNEQDNLFQTRLLAVLLEYGDKGLNLSNIPKKWNRIWPDVPLDSFFEKDKDNEEGSSTSTMKRKPGQLLALIKRRAGSVVRIVRKNTTPAGGDNTGKTYKKGAILVIPKNLSRKDVLDYDRQQND